MTSFLYTVIVYPIELLVELLFVFFFKAFDSTGFAIAGISLMVSLLSLPLYHIADQLQKKERDMRIQMQNGIQRIKSTFKGDEQYMILSTFYRQHHYHPAYALRSSVSLLIQVPFFIAAYQFLSHLPHLQAESFLFIKDLGQPDHMFMLGSLPINVLPLIMTLINIAAGAIYTKGFPLRDKVQLYGMAGLFLILLYQSPAGLVFYWTLNNVFSLVKNIFYKMKQPLKVLYVTAVVASVGLTVAILVIKSNFPLSKQLVLFAGCGGIISLPFLVKIVGFIEKRYLSTFSMKRSSVFNVYILSILLLWFLSGIVVPSSLILSSPIEFAFTGTVENPLSYMYHTASFFLGLCVVWPLFLYAMASRKMRGFFSIIFFILSLTAIINLFIFKGDYGLVSKVLLYDEPARLSASLIQTVLPIFITIILSIGTFACIRNGWSKVLTSILTILILTSAGMGVYAAVNIQIAYTAHAKNVAENVDKSTLHEINPVIPLSKTEKNVVVLFLDRAINSFLPIVFEQFPELTEQYRGFVYYPNTVSPGRVTLSGSPPVMGGYEYTPDAMNLRSTERLVDKHNEASLVLPRIFSEAGYRASVFDPPMPNHKWSNDFTAFRPYPEVQVRGLNGVYSYKYKMEHPENELWGPDYESRIIKRRLPMFSFLRTIYPAVRSLLYYEGTYFLMDENTQNTNSFINAYSVLYYLPQLTAIDSAKGSYVFLVNDTPHEPIFLQAPEYVPVVKVTDISNPLQADTYYDQKAQIHYHANVAALRKVGEWLEFLKQEGVYDNTRIIIVADHGNNLKAPVFKDFEQLKEVLAAYHPLFMAKDFYASEEFSTDTQFMTTADVPAMAIKDLPVSTINPFTKNDLFSVIEKDVVNVYSSSSEPNNNRGNTFSFNYSESFSVHDSVFDEANWKHISPK
ncbi:membrane protein insertase, YidC/Oxa1 family, C-terminal domain-containing protein [Sphaerochaeta associata]|uniref:YidC/Oxa1 family membrane protein insertase n=1 Tax=Sphaerochaeta associata TaxID=1129264 RepID=A0ABY4DBC3_9SPIR|nr:YidC/Oxa1 family membrane protein insertase [Sphaerochaeta associata]UOM51574.1 YidC/Oxa1 family membrane protein insertase [Sphaerochaeta associata]SMP65675.1 membrane protein insertase, YidC/Oxa1 family, C-terminal domain-containing protein [Sphaerochaeta associata]